MGAAERSDLVLVVGTSGVVYPAAALPLRALEVGVPLVEVNPEETPLTPHATASLRGPAGVVLPALVGAAFGPGSGSPSRPGRGDEGP
jgi:NAD-dependent deacetylase